MTRSRAWRRHQTQRIANARRKYSTPGMRMSDNELAVRHPYDCGSRCFMCHLDKLLLGGRRRAAAKRALDKETNDA